MKKKKKSIILVLLLVLIFSIGYAAIQSVITVNGTANIKGSSFNVHFENVSITEGSAEIHPGLGDSNATIESVNKQRVDYAVTFYEPGDFYEFTVKAVNAGSLDAMVGEVISKMNGSVITTLPAYLRYSVTYGDGTQIASKHKLDSGEVETYKVRVEYRNDINESDLPKEEVSLSFSFEVKYVQKDGTAIDRLNP